ncbi:MAG: hypothetical protein IJ317_00780 [Clostridia bacterium]|nr:hypothetical protein [Clostridia bacterium]
MAKAMTKRMKTLMLSGMTILLCVMIMVAGSFALFSQNTKNTTHLIAGELNAKLERTALTTTKLNSAGYLVTENEQTAEDDPVDFTAETEENVFGLSDGELIVPCTVLTATMQLSNDGDVAFGYYIAIVAQDGYEKAELAKQIKVTVADENGELLTDAQYLSDGLTIGAENDYVAVVETNQTATFTVTIEFENRDDNNDAQNAETIFDLAVYATQVTDDPNA